MKAVQINEFGGADAMRYQDVADPAPGSGEAVVEIQAAGVNFTDVYSRAGINPGPPLPRTIGVEGAGVVKSVGKASPRSQWATRWSIAVSTGPMPSRRWSPPGA